MCPTWLWETDTKTHQRRHVALDPESVAILADHRQRCEQDAAQLGATLTDEHFIFSATPEGTAPVKPSVMSQRYRRCARRLGIRTTLHRLRHYSATELITAGVDIRTVAGRLGHGGGGTTTLKVYAAWIAAADQHASVALLNRDVRLAREASGSLVLELSTSMPSGDAATGQNGAQCGGQPRTPPSVSAHARLMADINVRRRSHEGRTRSRVPDVGGAHLHRRPGPLPAPIISSKFEYIDIGGDARTTRCGPTTQPVPPAIGRRLWHSGCRPAAELPS